MITKASMGTAPGDKAVGEEIGVPKDLRRQDS